jgi:hypothetical protein
MGGTPSATTSSKRSREPSDDEEEIEASEVRSASASTGKGKGKKKSKTEAARGSAYKRANVSGGSKQPMDLQYLHVTRGGAVRPRKDRPGAAPSQALGVGDDTTRSFEDMRIGWDRRRDQGDGGSGSSQPSSHKGSRSRSRR